MRRSARGDCELVGGAFARSSKPTVTTSRVVLGPIEHVVLGPRPDSDLLEFRVLDDAELVVRGDDRDANRGIGRVPHLVDAFGTSQEARDFARFQDALTLWCADRRSAVEDNQPLLVGPFEVVRT